MKTKLLMLLLLLTGSQIFSQNLQLQANMTYPYALANIGGYVDTAGNEYALVGTYQGLSIVDVTIPSNPVIKFNVPGPQSEWREVKTYRKFAYVTTEGGGGLQIIDMSGLPDTVIYKAYTGDAAIAGQLSSIHALHCDTATAYLYLYGSNINSGNSLFISLSDPWNPHYVGQYTYPGGGNASYVHDGFVVNDTMYEAHVYAGFFDVLDVRNKSNPILLATQSTPTNFTHNTWLSNDHHTLFATDENSGSYLTAYDISDLGNITELSRFQTAPGTSAIVHNVHILNDFAVTSWYVEGVVITDMARPRNPIQVGKYDTYSGTSVDGFNGCWGVYPFLPSGTIVASDINNGLFVFSPTYVRGCYLEGTVTDSTTGIVLNGALVEILSTTTTKLSDNIGEYRTGLATAGAYDIRVSKAGYTPKVITAVQLSNGVLTTLDVQLVPLQTYTFLGMVMDSLTGDPVANAEVVLVASGLAYRATSNVSGNFSLANVVPDLYTVYAGKWGYRTSCSSLNLTQGTVIMPTLAQGYYDDFTFNNGWSVSGTSANAWVRCEPIGTYDGNNTEINPDQDVSTDCSDSCFVTDNGGAPYNNTDVDGGNTLLTSPVFDATIYSDPVLNYYRRFLDINGNGTPNDSMKIKITNGLTTVTVENILHNATGNGTWLQHSVHLNTLLTSTANMRLTVDVADITPGNICEGAFDKFEVTGTITTKVPELSAVDRITLSAYPNPFGSEVTIYYYLIGYNVSSQLIISDLTGRILEENQLESNEGSIKIGKNLSAGIYLVQLKTADGVKAVRIVKR